MWSRINRGHFAPHRKKRKKKHDELTFANQGGKPMLRRIYDFFSLGRLFEFLFDIVKFIATRFEKPVMAFLDWRWGAKYPYTPERGSTKQFVIQPFDKAFVGWPVIESIVGPFFGSKSREKVETINQKEGVAPSMLAIPVFIVMALAVSFIVIRASPQARRLLLPKNLPDLSLEALPLVPLLAIILAAVAIILVLWLAKLVAVYWYYEWWRRHKILTGFTDELIHKEAAPRGLALTPFHSGARVKPGGTTPVDEIMEIETATDIESLPGGQKTPKLQDLWSEYLTKKYEVQAIRFASRSGAHDLFPSVAYAPNVVGVIKKYVNEGKTYMELLRRYRANEQELLSKGAGTAQFDLAKRTREVEKLWEPFDRLYPQPIKKYPNLFEEEDPGLWDFKSGEKVTTIPRPGGDRETGFNLEEPKPRNPTPPPQPEAAESNILVERTEEKELDKDLFPLRIDRTRSSPSPPLASEHEGEEIPDEEDDISNPWERLAKDSENG